jgi:hypothetical protein
VAGRWLVSWIPEGNEREITMSGEEPEYPDDLIPDIGNTDWPDLVGFIKSSVGIRQGYSTFVPKSNGIGRPVSGGKETFIRCPSPSHVDKRPSAWMQESEGLWYCAACNIGGDVLDLAAFASGLPVPEYKADAALFGDLVQSVASRLGITEQQARSAGFVSESRPPEAADVSPEWPDDFTPEEMAEAQLLHERWEEAGLPDSRNMAVRDVMARRSVRERGAELASEPQESDLEESMSRELDYELASLVKVRTAEVAGSYDEALEKGLLVELGCDPKFPHIPWQDVIPPDTPIYRMLKATCVTDIPDEYFIWAIYTALGSMIGRRVELMNSRGAVDPALWTVIIGSTGSSKSTVAVEMDRILAKVAPVVGNNGVKIIGVPASGERFLEQIRRDESVSMGMTVELEECPNSATFMYADEFALLGALLSRAGSTLTPLLLQAYSLKRDYILRPTESMSRVTFPVTGPMVSILSTTQPNRISEMLSRHDVASGFMNRFIFGSGKPRRVCVPMMGFGPDWQTVEQEFNHIQDRLSVRGAFLGLTDKAYVDKPWQLGPDTGGLTRMREWIYEQGKELEGADDYTADLLARRELMILKITLLMAINRIAGGDDWKHWTEGDVNAAIAHYPNIAEGWMDTGKRVLDTDELRLAEWVVARIEETGEIGIARRDLNRAVPKSMRGGHKSFNEVIVSLSQNGLIREVELRQGGKSKKAVKWLYPADNGPMTNSTELSTDTA